ncbi:hypothetical protein B0T26DRAFT_798644 [Lasiosphaeria miniovina]|uniref:BTB domain-containing protein n=1 Tax=Lasiosphaeria miniovina TaxID=1954250 RepID=A0AA40BIN5_9PEZI|nr:uncharacterized protein B0T26DRAFT_798644 [Lasiosphaeria miniovina]KAK0734935.1 hypothetical protein B0T26DRAFT_798644 [Lasiosphaeria miniovina]
MASPADIVIAPHGDIHLLVGPNAKRIKVQSLILRVSSTGFFTLSGPNGLWIDAKTISLPDEDGEEALVIVLNAVHYRADKIDDPLPPDMILRVAIVSEKYGFTQPLKLCARDWLKCDNVHDVHKLCQLAIASILFQDEKSFSDTTLKLLRSYAGSYWRLAAEVKESLKRTPETAFRFAGMMEERRTQLRMDLLFHVLHRPFLTEQQAQILYSCSKNCIYRSHSYMHYIKVLANPLATQLVESSLTLARVSEISIDKVIEDIESRNYSLMDFS